MKEDPIGRVQVLEGQAMKRAALYLRVSTADQSPEMQRYDLERLAAQRGFAIVDLTVGRG
jgi:DNA invertase Pin-like site-specific DNA recombinase